MIFTITVLFLVVGIGYLAKSIKLVKAKHAEILQKIILNITLPVAIVASFMNSNLTLDHTRIMATGIISTIIGLAAIMLFFKLIFKDKKIYGTAVPLAFFSNAGFLGLPIMQKLFGDEGLSLALSFQLSSHGAPLLFTVGAAIFAYYGIKGQGFGIKQVLRKVFLNPIIIAIPIGIILGSVTFPSQIIKTLNLISLPEITAKTIEVISSANIFLIMFTVGLLLTPKRISKKFLMPTIIIVFTTLVAIPLLTFFLGKFLLNGGISHQIATLESAMPTAVLIVLLVKQYKLEVELAESVLFASTILSIITLPMLQWWLF